jgi:hypothetical protein
MHFDRTILWLFNGEGGVMARTSGATNKSEREHKKDAELSLKKAEVARLKAENKALQDAEKEAKKK